MKPYLYMIKIKLLLALNYKYQVFITFLTQIILLFTTAFFWKAAFKGIDTVAMVNERQMLIYSVVAIILGDIFTMSVEGNMRQKVRKGNVAVDFIKPVDIFLMYFSEDIGNVVTSIVQRGLPILIFASLFVVAPLPASGIHFVLFLISACFSYLIMWFISAVFGLFYFWAVDIGPIGSIKDYVILILSGSFVPIWFFPEAMQRVLGFMPFVYIYQLPVGVFVGRTSLIDAVKGMGIQMVWILIFAFLFSRIKNHVEKNILVQGG